MTKNDYTNKGSEATLDQLVAGLQANVPSSAVILVDGVSFAQPDLVKKATEEAAYFKAVRAANETWKKALAELRAHRPEIRKFLKGAKVGMKAYLGNDNPDIEKFGFHLDRVGRLSTEEKAIRADKARRTREARHTMGARQKEGIRAPDVASVVIPNPSAPEPGPSGPTASPGGAAKP